VSVEAGHLAAAFVEWPDSTPRGLFHTLVAAAQGLAAVALYFGLIRLELRLAIALNTLAAISWPVGALLGLSPYHQYPTLAAVLLTIAEATLTALIAQIPPSIMSSRSS
jgi:hypothetical protein